MSSDAALGCGQLREVRRLAQQVLGSKPKMALSAASLQGLRAQGRRLPGWPQTASSPQDTLRVCLHSGSQTEGLKSFTSKGVFFGWRVNEETDQRATWVVDHLWDLGVGVGRREKGGSLTGVALSSPHPCVRVKSPSVGSPQVSAQASLCRQDPHEVHMQGLLGPHVVPRVVFLLTHCVQPGGQVLYTRCGARALVFPIAPTPMTQSTHPVTGFCQRAIRTSLVSLG